MVWQFFATAAKITDNFFYQFYLLLSVETIVKQDGYINIYHNYGRLVGAEERRLYGR